MVNSTNPMRKADIWWQCKPNLTYHPYGAMPRLPPPPVVSQPWVTQLK